MVVAGEARRATEEGYRNTIRCGLPHLSRKSTQPGTQSTGTGDSTASTEDYGMQCLFRCSGVVLLLGSQNLQRPSWHDVGWCARLNCKSQQGRRCLVLLSSVHRGSRLTYSTAQLPGFRGIAYAPRLDCLGQILEHRLIAESASIMVGRHIQVVSPSGVLPGLLSLVLTKNPVLNRAELLGIHTELGRASVQI